MQVVFVTTDAFVYLCIELWSLIKQVFINSFQE